MSSRRRKPVSPAVSSDESEYLDATGYESPAEDIGLVDFSTLAAALEIADANRERNEARAAASSTGAIPKPQKHVTFQDRPIRQQPILRHEGPPVRIRFADLPTFGGATADSIFDYLQGMRDSATAYAVSPDVLLRYVPRTLFGAARFWYDRQDFATFADFSRAIINRFCGTALLMKKKRDLATASLTDFPDMSSYIDFIAKNSRDVGALPEDECLSLFQGLPPNYRIALIDTPKSNVDVFIQKLEEIDTYLRERSPDTQSFKPVSTSLPGTSIETAPAPLVHQRASCYRCGSYNHLIRQCPVRSSSSASDLQGSSRQDQQQASPRI
jgi:hypothetical protein